VAEWVALLRLWTIFGDATSGHHDATGVLGWVAIRVQIRRGIIDRRWWGKRRKVVYRCEGSQTGRDVRNI